MEGQHVADCWGKSIHNTNERKEEMKQQEMESTQAEKEDLKADIADILEEIEIEDLLVDGICGVY